MAGVITSFLLGAPLIYITAMIASDLNEIAGIVFVAVIGIFIPAFSGGLVCGYLSPKKDYTNILTTSLILLFILALNNDFKSDGSNYRIWLLICFVIFSTFIGGSIGFKIKKKLPK